jgi:diaminohydroxyphosphoribosylaminopyrimidine deaminase / 5-amino-6-(5-phosphoribosylamino)uracil reductase
MTRNLNRDRGYMEMAYGLAGKGRGWSNPNPHVGAVVVEKDRIVGYGYHQKAGLPHAEAIALKMAGDRAKNGTAFITLEPCVHWGRTPPCIDAVLGSGLARVVISALDPNPRVHTKGITALTQAGIKVDVGLLENKNRRLNEFYIKYIRTGNPFVTVKTAASLDGKIATGNGSSQWITGPETRNYIHLLRGEYSALMIGINTLIHDDPRLTVRHPHWEGKTIHRVILDTNLRFPINARMLNTLEDGPILVFCSIQASKEKAAALESKGIQIIRGEDRSIDPRWVLDQLGAMEISSVFVEGGGGLYTSLFENRLVDKIVLTMAPKLIGGADALSFFQGTGVKSVSEALKIKQTEAFSLGQDIIIEGYPSCLQEL